MTKKECELVARRSRMKMRELGAVTQRQQDTSAHYALVIAADGGEILAQASTLEVICGWRYGNADGEKVGVNR